MTRQQGGSGLAANGARERQTKPRSRRLADPIERRIDLALRSGEFIGDRACFSFVSSLDGVAAEVRALTRSDPARATALCEAFLAGCLEKVEELAERSGHKAEDCLAVAKLLAGQKPNQALTWVERGRALDRDSRFRCGAGYDLDEVHRQLLTKLGRKNEALEAAWAGFREQPSKFTYDDLMKFVPKAERQEWQKKALSAAKSEDLHSLLELFVKARAMERL